MSTPEQIAANRRNALLAGGPVTAIGKVRSAQNALHHGLRAEQAVIPGERAEEWLHHHQGIVASLAPADAFEEELAGRVALCLWRLRRVARFETAVTAAGLDAVDEDCTREAVPSPSGDESDMMLLDRLGKDLEKKRARLARRLRVVGLLEQLPGLPSGAACAGDDAEDVLDALGEAASALDPAAPAPEDAAFLEALGVPAAFRDDPRAWGGWTAGRLRRGLKRLAEAVHVPAKRLLAEALREQLDRHRRTQTAVAALETQYDALRQRLQKSAARLRLRRVLPDDKELDKAMRYEAHLTRQMLHVLHTLERLRAARFGPPAAPPLVLDVNLETVQRIAPPEGEADEDR